MRNCVYLLAICATLGLNTLTSCQSCVDAANKAKEAMEEKANDRTSPRYLHDSEEWGKVVKNRIDVTDFSKLEAVGLVDIVYEQKDAYSVFVHGNEKVLDLYDFEVNNGKLQAKFKSDEKGRKTMPAIRIYVEAPNVDFIHMSGSGDVYLTSPAILEGDLTITIDGSGDIDIKDLSCAAFKVQINGSGDFNMDNLECENASMTVNGSGDVKAASVACMDDASFVINGSGDINSSVTCRNLHAELNGDGEAKFNVKSTLVEAISVGKGEIELKGTTKKFIKQKRGLGKIVSKDLEADDVELR